MSKNTEYLCKIRDVRKEILLFEDNFQKYYNISLNEGMMLCTLSKYTSCSSGELSEHLGLTHSNTSKIISSAEKKGLVMRILGDKDKRKMYFTLTKEGENTLDFIKQTEIKQPKISIQ